jgi:hypothetical protein
MPPERRAHHRYPPVETAYAALGAEYSRVGKIRDFSLGGLSFEYIDHEVQNGRKVTVDVFLVDDSFHIHNLPCRIIYDVPLSGGDENAAPLFNTRRCGVDFTPHTSEQEKQIRIFVQKHTNP